MNKKTVAQNTTTRSEAIRAAHIPTYLKVMLLALHDGDRDEVRSYLDVGFHLGRYHLEDFIENQKLVSDADPDEVLAHPTQLLRQMFANDSHPNADLVNLIPYAHRSQFLIGILAGAEEDEPGEGWLAIAA